MNEDTEAWVIPPVQEITDGLWDDHLGDIVAAVKFRQSGLPVAVGDTIRVTDECHPQYWRGVVATVTKVQTRRRHGMTEVEYAVQPLADDFGNQTRLIGTKMAVFSNGETRFRGMRLPRNLIELVDA